MDETTLLRFQVSDIIKKARRVSRRHVNGVTINLPFISVNMTANDTERRVATELIIRLSDRRVLDGPECCDNCIDQALESLQGIRETIVNKQVELHDATDGPLYLLLEMMAEGIRQFLTFEQRLDGLHREPVVAPHPDFRRAPEVRKAYFRALETLRGHLSRCLIEIAKIGDVALPKANLTTRYDTPWPIEAYEQPRLPE